MDSILRFKKSMVYPERNSLNQLSRKTSALSNTSWCAEPLTVGDNHNSDVLTLESVSSDSEKDNCTPVSPSTNSAMIANKQFIQNRVRHLVDAFTHRTRTVRQKIELPPTPSSLSSQEPTPHTSKSRVTESVEKCWEDSSSENQVKHSKNFFTKVGFYYNSTVFDPQGKTYIAWMCIAALAVLYNVWVIPLRSTFPYQTPSNRAVWMFFDYFTDVIYIIDVVFIQTRITYVDEGFTISDYKATKQHYLKKKYFKMDIFSLMPLDLLYFYCGPDNVILRFPRFFKIHTFWAFFDLIDKLIASPHIIRITRTLMYMMYLIHINACAYYGVSLWNGIGSNSFVYNGRGNAYIVCFYFATKTATSIGKNPKPTQEHEFMFMTFSWLMGVFVFALLIGQIRDIIATATRSKTEYKKLVDETLEYMRRLNLPQDMQRRAQLWFNYTWETQRTLDETILDFLPNKTKTDIAINVHIKTLSKVKLFADCDEALLRELVLQLKSVIYLPGDIICKKGDVGKEMYILQSGKVKVMGRTDEEVLATLSEGCVFGEISLLGIAGMNRRTADVRSYGYSNLFVLSKSDLNEALRHYPEAQELLNKKAKQLMKENEELERKNMAIVVINNPKPKSEPKLANAVIQVISSEEKTIRNPMQGPKKKNKVFNRTKKFQSRYNFPVFANKEGEVDTTFQTKVTVHRSFN